MSDLKEKLTDAQIIEHLVYALKINNKQLADELDYKSHQTIYHVTNGRNRISQDMINRIILKFPEVNPDFLRTGTGNPLKYKTDRKIDIYNQEIPEASLKDIMETPKRLYFMERRQDDIISKLDRILEILEKNN